MKAVEEKVGSPAGVKVRLRTDSEESGQAQCFDLLGTVYVPSRPHRENAFQLAQSKSLAFPPLLLSDASTSSFRDACTAHSSGRMSLRDHQRFRLGPKWEANLSGITMLRFLLRPQC